MIYRRIPLLFLCLSLVRAMPLLGDTPKIHGVSLVSPPVACSPDWTGSVLNLNADWVAIMPYGFGQKGDPRVYYNAEWQWWGEKPAGARVLIRQAHEKGLKVLLKPMVYFHGSWPGGFSLDTDEKWETWEEDYRHYLRNMAELAEEEGVEALSLGTEFKASAVGRAPFWRDLAQKTRTIYHGQLTYSANWDEFHQIAWWDELDWIGVNGYFPLSQDLVPTASRLVKNWGEVGRLLEKFAKVWGKPLVFTEFGYRSVEGCAGNQWALEGNEVSLEAQNHAFEAFFESIWKESWLGGIFVWQWYTDEALEKGVSEWDYTPQGKPAEETIRGAFLR